MKKNIMRRWAKAGVLGVGLMAISAGSVFAEVSFPKHSVEVGTEISYIKYEEPDVMEETGAMFGVVATYAYHNKLMLKAQGKWSGGKVDYDGKLNSGAAYEIKGVTDYMVEARGLGGYDFSVSDTITITPYFGFGYRYLNDDLSKDPAGYTRESNYFYSPIGVEAIASLNENWSLGAMVEFDIFWAGVQKSHLSNLSAGQSDIENDQKNGYGIRGSIMLQKVGDKVNLVVEPYIRYWNIGESETTPISYGGSYVGYGYEPKNHSTEIGARFAVKF